MNSSQSPQQINKSNPDEIARCIFEQLEKFKEILDTDPKILLARDVDTTYVQIKKIKAAIEQLENHKMILEHEAVREALKKVTETTRVIEASLLIGEGKYEEAIKCCDEIIGMNPENAEPWHDKGRSLFSLHRHGEAIECYDKSIRINPKYFDPWFWKGVTLILLDRKKEGTVCIEEARKIDPARVKKLLRE